MQKNTALVPDETTPTHARVGGRNRIVRWVLWAAGAAGTATLSVAILLAVALTVSYPNLPDISALSDYRPKLPLRVFTADGVLMGEFGEERRHYTRIQDIPKVVQDAVLAIEDANFYSHGGVDYKGVLRAALANLGRFKSQGASTITMQVARNVYLSSDRNFTRKIYEILLAFKLEHLLSKEQILEIYMNQIFLGNRAYGFAAAAQTYFGKSLAELTTAEAAMLAGLPKGPSIHNPYSNPKRARARQRYIIERMEFHGFITAQQAQAAKAEILVLKSAALSPALHADYVAETVRQLIFAQYGDETYSRGLNVYTTVKASEQEAAYSALRKGIMDFERKQIYRGPEKFIALPTTEAELEETIDDALTETPDNGDILSAVVLDANAKKVQVVRQDGSPIEIVGEGLKPVQSGLAANAAPNIKIRRGAIVRIVKTPKNTWEITQLPEVEGAFVALDPRDGGIRAMVGGFDFDKSKLNRATQAWRQPGSSFKPFIYSAALEKGFTPATIINDAALFFDAGVTGGLAWEPKNYDGKFDGPLSMRTALARSKNMVSIRILNSIGANYAQDWITRFGFDADKHPPYLTMALGAGSVTPLQMASAYAVFANGGVRVNPWLISKVAEQKGKVLLDTKPPVLDESQRGVDARNAFIMNSLLSEVTRSGTAARAQAALKRPDLYGKTGTTNDSMDAWFVGFQPSIVAATWIGYDTPRKLGSGETGGGLSLPVWISFMETALKGVPVAELSPPEGVIQVAGEWYYDEYVRGAGVASVGMHDADVAKPDATAGSQTLPAADEKKKILDLFKN